MRWAGVDRLPYAPFVSYRLSRPEPCQRKNTSTPALAVDPHGEKRRLPRRHDTVTCVALTPCDDASPFRWIAQDGSPWSRLVSFGPSGFAAYARMRFVPDPAYEGQQEADADAVNDEAEQLRMVFDVLAEHTRTRGLLLLSLGGHRRHRQAGFPRPRRRRGCRRVSGASSSTGARAEAR